MKENFYDILGLVNSATAEEIKSAFRQAAKKYHPDINHGEGAAKKFKEVHRAYAILSSPTERKIYDESLISSKIPKDIFTEPKATTQTQTTYTQPTEEEKRRQEEIKKYRKSLIIQAIIKIALYALGGALGGYALISIGKILEEQGWPISLFSWAQFAGVLSGLIIGFIWSVDRYFKIETFITKPNVRKMFKHFRTAAFALAFTYLATFLWSLLLKTGARIPSIVTIIAIMSFVLISATFASDGEMRNRAMKGEILAIFVIAWHNFLIGISGLLVGVIIGFMFYIIEPNIDYIYLSGLFGFVFAILLGSVAPEGLDQLTDKINKTLRTVIYGILLVVAFAIGLGAGYLIGMK